MRTRINRENGRVISTGDEKFLRGAMRKFGIHKLKVLWSNSAEIWPDIWVVPDPYPIISVTAEWKRQDADERRARLVHELLHTCGMRHGEKGKYTFSTYPRYDSFSKEVYRRLIK